MWKLKQLVAGDEEREESFLEDESDGICSLSYTQRMYAFAACLLAGLSIIVFVRPIKFAILFTFGNLLAVGSTAFVIGPAQQINMMFDSARIYATTVYLVCVLIALICALLIHSKILTILAIICEICALLWYSLSYIPFARRMISELMIRLSGLVSVHSALKLKISLLAQTGFIEADFSLPLNLVKALAIINLSSSCIQLKLVQSEQMICKKLDESMY
ncbi:Vesicle transport protein [Citrus sinensis]|nr:Vesicle transport protein [Citrus sinensis]